jgi:hypothetical protein
MSMMLLQGRIFVKMARCRSLNGTHHSHIKIEHLTGADEANPQGVWIYSFSIECRGMLASSD